MISLPPKGNDAKVLGAYFEPLKVQALATPDMYVKVAEGAFWTADNEHQEYIGGTSPLISAPGADAKWVLVTVTANGALNLINGVAGSNPVLPDVALYKDELPLAAIFVGDTVTAITNDMIYDLRPMWQIPPDSVSQSQLNNFATITQLNNGLATKAEHDGTNDANFTLNIGGGAINDSGLYIDRNAGPDVAIRFNELATSGSPAVVTPQWEFTNDGATWNPIGVASGSYYTKADLDAGALNGLYYLQNQLTGVSGSGVLDSRYYEQAIADSTFEVIGHTHLSADITDLNPQVETVNLIAPVAGDVSLNINDILDVRNVGPASSHVLAWSTANSRYENRTLITNDLSDVDTVTVAPVAGDVMIHSGGLFTNRQLVKTDISDFGGGEFVLTTNVAGDAPAGDGPPDSNGTPQDIYGVKTFKDGIVIENSLSVSGTNTAIATTALTVSDDHVDINYGETGDGVGNGSGTSGIRIDRGTSVGSPGGVNPPAIIQWDENAGQWEIGVEGNLGKVLTGAHTHTAAQITDFDNAVTAELASNQLNTLQDVTYILAPSSGDHLMFDFGAGQWENTDFATDVGTVLNANDLEQMQDVSYVGVAAGEVLMWTGSPGSWENHLLVKADVSDFVEADYIHTTGDETKTGNLIIDGDFTVNNGVGSETRLKSEHVYISDTVITLNADEIGAGVGGGSGTAGIEVERGSEPTASLFWNETTDSWFMYDGTTQWEIEDTLHTHTLDKIIDVTATFTEVNYTQGVIGPIQPQLDDKISRQGDAMDPAVHLTFSAGGEVRGLPATPSGATAATSAQYVDDQITAAAGSLATHIADDTLHITADQNTFLDGLAIAGSPGSLTASDVNELTGITGNVQTQLDGKAALAVPAVTGNVAILTALGDLADGNIIFNDLGAAAATTAWSSNKITTDFTAKVIPALNGNLAGLSTPNGDIVDSGLILNDSGTLASEIWSAQKIDGVKANKVTPANDTNLARLDLATGDLEDSGVRVDDTLLTTAAIWTASKIDTTKADKVVPALTSNLAGLDAAGNLEDSGVIVNDAGTALTEIWTANKIDTTKADKVGGAVVGNFAAFDGTGNIVDSTYNGASFSAPGHLHTVSNITDFNTGVDTYITTLAVLDDVSDVAAPAPAALDILQRNAGNTAWVNESIFTVFGTDFVRSSGSVAESITGVKTFNDVAAFSDSVTISGDLTVLGTTTTIDTANLEVTDKNITVNHGYVGASSGSTGSGIHVNRGTAGSPLADFAMLYWDDAPERWKAGIDGGALDTIALEGVTVAQPLYEMVQAPAAAGSPVTPELVYTLSFGVPVPAAGTTGLQVFVNGVKQIEGAGKSYTVNYSNPSQIVVTFNSVIAAPTIGADVEFYGFGYIA